MPRRTWCASVFLVAAVLVREFAFTYLPICISSEELRWVRSVRTYGNSKEYDVRDATS